MEIHSLFPVALGIFDFNRTLTEQELEFIRVQKTHANMGNTTSDNTQILDCDEIADIKAFIEVSVKDYFSNVYSPSNDASLRITQSWLNYTDPGQFHHKHAHPNSFVSGVFYPQSNESDRIYFHKGEWQQLHTPTKNWNSWNSSSWWMPATTGRMYIFPSHLTHHVETYNKEGNVTRISLSFNTFPIGNWGQDDALTGLKL